MVKATEGPAGAKLDHIRDILHGTQFKGFEQKFQRHENALEKTRAELRERIKAAETAARELERTSRKEHRETEKQLSGRIERLDSALKELKKDTKGAVEDVRKNGDVSHKKLKKEMEAVRRALEGSLTALKEDTTAQINALREEFTAELGTLREELTGRIGAIQKETQNSMNTLTERQKRIRKDLSESFRHELADEAAKQSSQAQHLFDDLAATVSDLQETLTDRVSTLGETMISRHALGEALVALGAQLLGAVKEPLPASEADHPEEDTPGENPAEPAKAATTARRKGKPQQVQ